MRRFGALTLMGIVVAQPAHGASAASGQIRLITLDPGHFHASLVQKFMYPQVSPVVHVYAPEGEDLTAHLNRIRDFNARADNPTHWQEEVYTKPDFLEEMARDKAGNVVVIAGNNTRKTEYIDQSINAGFNVLADKPMAINPQQFQLLRQTFDHAKQKKVLLYDIMTERFEITSIVQRELVMASEVFGNLEKGSPENPAIVMENMHYFFKEVAGKPLIRPAWFFDVRQEGEAIPDVGTHLIDQVQWQGFPERALDWQKDVKVLSARRWPTAISIEQFKRATGGTEFADFLKKDVDSRGTLQVFGNGELIYRLRGVHARVTARWDFEAPPGAKDTHQSVFRGSRGQIAVEQGPEQHYQPALYVQQTDGKSGADFEHALRAALSKISRRFPGVDLKPAGGRWEVIIPEKYDVGHEAHFAQVTENFLGYLAVGKLPEWEAPNMLAKYYTATEAWRMSHAR